MTDERAGPTGQAVGEAESEVQPESVEDRSDLTQDSQEEVRADQEVRADDDVRAGKPRRSGRLLAGFAVLLSLASGAGVGYLYYLTVYQAPLASVDARLTALQGSVQRSLEDAAEQNRESLAQAVASLRQDLEAQQQARLDAEQALAQSINDGMRLSPPSSREWKLAEVEYLLRIANHRLLMERDAAAAAQLLAAADQILAELDDYSLYPVRAQLAEERLALGNVDEIDIQGAFLRLEALKSTLDELPLRLPEYLTERRTGSPVEGERSLWQALLDRLGSFVEFRRYPDGGLRPLLSPDEAGYLEMNLRLMLERAQLAVLRRDALLYEHSVSAALSWLDDYLDPQSPTVAEVHVELQSLLTLELDRELPDISGSLINLRSLARYGIEDVERAPLDSRAAP